jgi:hypothetical protein
LLCLHCVFCVQRSPDLTAVAGRSWRAGRAKPSVCHPQTGFTRPWVCIHLLTKHAGWCCFRLYWLLFSRALFDIWRICTAQDLNMEFVKIHFTFVLYGSEKLLQIPFSVSLSYLPLPVSKKKSSWHYDYVCRFVLGTLPEQQKPNEYIKKLNLALRDDRRMRQLFRTLVEPDCTCKKAEDTVVRKKVKNLNLISWNCFAFSSGLLLFLTWNFGWWWWALEGRIC